MTFVYRQRFREAAQQRRDDAERRVKLQRATRSLVDEGNKAPLCALLREDGLDDLAELVALGRFPRGLPSEDALDLKACVRRYEKRYGERNRNGELLYGERQRSVDRILGAHIEMGELSLEDEDAIVAWRKAQELCERLEREAEADEEMSLEQYRQKIKPGITALRKAMCKDHDIGALREHLVKKLNHDAQREPRLRPPTGSVVVLFAR
jgi:hypothetical protein